MQVPSVLLAKYSGKFFLIILALFMLGWIVILIFTLIEPTAPVENVMVTNITDHQATISWTTPKPTHAGLIISETGKF